MCKRHLQMVSYDFCLSYSCLLHLIRLSHFQVYPGNWHDCILFHLCIRLHFKDVAFLYLFVSRKCFGPSSWLLWMVLPCTLGAVSFRSLVCCALTLKSGGYRIICQLWAFTVEGTFYTALSSGCYHWHSAAPREAALFNPVVAVIVCWIFGYGRFDCYVGIPCGSSELRVSKSPYFACLRVLCSVFNTEFSSLWYCRLDSVLHVCFHSLPGILEARCLLQSNSGCSPRGSSF